MLQLVGTDGFVSVGGWMADNVLSVLVSVYQQPPQGQAPDIASCPSRLLQPG